MLWFTTSAMKLLACGYDATVRSAVTCSCCVRVDVL